MRAHRVVISSLAVLVLLILSGVLAGCEKAEQAPTPTPNQEISQAASTLFAQPTRSPRMTPTVTPSSAVELELNRSIARMEQAALEGDTAGYLAYVWDSDPEFWTEQVRWAQDWQQHPLDAFDITLFSISTPAPDIATARLTLTWTLQELSGGATISAVFYWRDDRWLFGGENWHSFEAGGIQFYYFADDIVNNELQAEAVKEYLPGIYTRVTREFGFVPEQIARIKMYESPVTLQTMTRLSIPEISVWNEPGEAIKITVGPSNTAPREPDIAREYTRFVLYQMAGGTRDRFPWWLEDGLAEYGGGLFRTLSQRNRVIKQVAARVNIAPETGRTLAEWSSLDDPDSLTSDQLAGLTSQVFTLIIYITETHGADARNAWLQAIAAGQTPQAACETHLGLTFAELDASWRTWLLGQL